FAGRKGPGALPINKRKGKILAAICPHAGYVYSGMCAAWAYKAIGEAEIPDLYIIIGTAHTGFGSGISTEMWKTPFSEVRVDKIFAEALMKKSGLKENELAHADEHSVEVQLPFLQFVDKSEINRIKILPLVVSEDIDYKKLAIDLKETIIESGKKVMIIVSSDFTHYGHNYRYMPFTLEVEKNLYELDTNAIALIKKRDDEGFLKYVEETGATICGALPIALMLRTVRFSKAELLQYYQSGDLTGDYKNTVGYASIIFR
ncbi:MAG: AmmeMemoRadiSam system protein B, partial [Candidatus Woesearchaeota archaeon]|nr:AmmeMemoRadiSam system protein B [Candidatus Woesearchaeota archaeon]